MIADTVAYLVAGGKEVILDAEHFLRWIPGRSRFRAGGAGRCRRCRCQLVGTVRYQRRDPA